MTSLVPIILEAAELGLIYHVSPMQNLMDLTGPDSDDDDYYAGDGDDDGTDDYGYGDGDYDDDDDYDDD